MNVSTAIVLAIVIAILVLAARSVWKSRCNGGCSSCPSGGSSSSCCSSSSHSCSSCSACAATGDTMLHLVDLERELNAKAK